MADLFTSDNSFFFLIIFPALIDDPSSFEIKRMIRLVVSGMFLIPYSFFSSFQFHFLETLYKMDTFLKWTLSKADTFLHINS